MDENEKEMLEKIKEFIAKNNGVTINNIADHFDKSRATVVKYLSYLLGKGEITERRLGRTRVFYKK